MLMIGRARMKVKLRRKFVTSAKKVAFGATSVSHFATRWLLIVSFRQTSAKAAARNNGVLGMMYAVKSGVGIGLPSTASPAWCAYWDRSRNSHEAGGC